MDAVIFAPVLVPGAFFVHRAWVHTCECESRCELVVNQRAKVNSGGGAVKNDLLADEGYVHKVDAIWDPLQKIEAVVDFSALAQAVERG